MAVLTSQFFETPVSFVGILGFASLAVRHSLKRDILFSLWTTESSVSNSVLTSRQSDWEMERSLFFLLGIYLSSVPVFLHKLTTCSLSLTSLPNSSTMPTSTHSLHTQDRSSTEAPTFPCYTTSSAAHRRTRSPSSTTTTAQSSASASTNSATSVPKRGSTSTARAPATVKCPKTGKQGQWASTPRP